MSKFFEGIKKGFKDVVDFEKGIKALRTRSIELPEPSLVYIAKEKIRG